MVRRSDWALRQRATRAWSPERSTAGTSQSRKLAGRVYCGYSTSDSSPKDSSMPEPSLPITTSTSRSVVAPLSGPEPGDRLDDDERGRCAPREHLVADRQLAVATVIGDTL